MYFLKHNNKYINEYCLNNESQQVCTYISFFKNSISFFYYDSYCYDYNILFVGVHLFREVVFNNFERN